MSVNYVIQQGRLVRDPELSTLRNNTPMCKFSIAVQDKVKENKKVYFQEVVVFGNYAETVTRYFKKGSEIIIEGKLIQDRWENNADGKTRQKRYIKADKFSFGKDKFQNTDSGYSKNNEPEFDFGDDDNFNDDVPF